MHYGPFIGNAHQDSQQDGWIVGHFMPPRDPRHTKQVEVRYARLSKGTAKKSFGSPVHSTTFWLMLAGRLRNSYLFPGASKAKDITCSKGEYAVIAPDASHCWEVEEDCEVLAVRWPSCSDIFPRPPRISIPPYAHHNAGDRRSPLLVTIFMPPDDLRCAPNVTIRYDEYMRDKTRVHWTEHDVTTLMVLGEGMVMVYFPSLKRTITLDQKGCYILADATLPHQITALVNAKVVTISWPSPA